VNPEGDNNSPPELDLSSIYPDHWYEDDFSVRRLDDDYPHTPGRFDDVWGIPGQTTITEGQSEAKEAAATDSSGGAASLVPLDNKWDTSKIPQSCQKPMGLFKNRVTGQRVPMRCNAWDCPYCGKIKKLNVLKRVERGFDRVGLDLGMRIRSITLTQKLGSVRNLMEDWAALRHLLSRAGYHLRYFWSKEFTINGQRHLHLLINAYIPQKTLSLMWKLVTDGESYIVWINAADHGNFSDDIRSPAGYMSKYLTKAYNKNEVSFNKGEHRYGFSRYDLFKTIKHRPLPPADLSPIQLLEYRSFPSPWIADRSVASMFAALRLGAG
jgi:hypothetical protein